MGSLGIGKENIEMSTLIIYDNTGFIISQMSGDVREPIGIPFIWVEIPVGKRLVGIDTDKEEHEPIFEDIPKSEVEILNEQIATQEHAILELSMMIGGNA